MKSFAAGFATATAFMLLLTSGVTQAADGKKSIVRNIVKVFAPPTDAEKKTIATRVGLDEEQRAEMAEVNERYAADVSSLKSDYEAAYEGVVELMEMTEPSKSVVNEKLSAFHDVHQKMVDHEVKYWTDFKGILTGKQNKKFWALFEESRVRR